MSTITFQNKINTISQHVLALKEQLVQQQSNLEKDRYTKQDNQSLYHWRTNLVEIYAYSIAGDLDKTFTRLKEWGTDEVNLLVDLNLSLETAINEVRFYRDTIGEILKIESIKNDFSLEEFYDVITRFDSVVDRAVYWLTNSYSRTYNSRILAAESIALELSIPVVKVTNEVGILPLVGDIDTKRAQQLMDKALLEGTKLDLKYLVIDLSGVPIIDTMVADQIFKVISALKLTGIHTVLTGIRPEIAQTMIHLGIKVEGVPTYASLHQAMRKLLPCEIS
ncbi:STAS domain-containing protein [Domibacillus robiginosus]|uniref:STAS domain-containing protein n=1 Tax=Domibacillus robiginosus TaxID=1071054 RepID=UPI00067B6DF2|nr:STAS domain-containing protein [Domibacillus robiginosus]